MSEKEKENVDLPETEETVQEAAPEMSETDRLKEELDKKSDDYLRLMAEFDNYRRRTAKERMELISVASEDVVKGILPIVDDFERALAVLRNSSEMEAAKEGTELIYNKLVEYLKTKGLAEIECVGKPLDTDFHEAVAQIPAPQAENKGLIFDVAQKGYTLNGKVIRFAKVVVAV